MRACVLVILILFFLLLLLPLSHQELVAGVVAKANALPRKRSFKVCLSHTLFLPPCPFHRTITNTHTAHNARTRVRAHTSTCTYAEYLAHAHQDIYTHYPQYPTHAHQKTKPRLGIPKKMLKSQIAMAKRQLSAANVAGISSLGEYDSRNGVGGGAGGGGGASVGATSYCPKKGQVLEFLFSQVCTCVCSCVCVCTLAHARGVCTIGAV